MSGICGILSLGATGDVAARFVRQECSRLTDELLCMGRDGRSSWSDDVMSLGHVQLRETPEAAFERQPLVSDDGCFVMVFDGRIDNRHELFAAIDERVVENQQRCCDAELTLRVYQRFGSATPSMLLGDFAFAVWNTAERSLFLTRDHVGGRLLYFVQTNEYFAFASRDEALLVLPGVTAEANIELVIHEYAPPLPKPSRSLRGWYRDVMRFPFGYVGTVSSHLPSIKLTHYLPWADSPKPAPRDFDEAVKKLTELITSAAAARMRSCNTPALFMSGGIDSASVISAMRRTFPHASSQGYGTIINLSLTDSANQNCIETKCIVHLHERYATKAVFVETRDLGGEGMRSLVARALIEQAHPQDNSIVTFFPLLERARQLGLTSVLSGVGGDMVADATSGSIERLWRLEGIHQAWRLACAMSLNNNYLRGVRPIRLIFAAVVQRSFSEISPRFRKIARLIRSSVNVRAKSFVRRHLLLRGLARTELRQSHEVAYPQNDQARPAVSLKLLGMRRAVGEAQDLLQHCASRFGVVTSDVWSDLRLVNFFFDLSPSITCRGGWTKATVREVLKRDRVHDALAQRQGNEHIGSDVVSAIFPALQSAIEGGLCNCRFPEWLDSTAVASESTRAMICKAQGKKPDFDFIEPFLAATLAFWRMRFLVANATKRYHPFAESTKASAQPAD